MASAARRRSPSRWRRRRGAAAAFCTDRAMAPASTALTAAALRDARRRSVTFAKAAAAAGFGGRRDRTGHVDQRRESTGCSASVREQCHPLRRCQPVAGEHVVGGHGREHGEVTAVERHLPGGKSCRGMRVRAPCRRGADPAHGRARRGRDQRIAPVQREAGADGSEHRGELATRAPAPSARRAQRQRSQRATALQYSASAARPPQGPS